VGGKLVVVAGTESYGRELWVEDIAPPLAGDYDLDDDIDGADFLLWQRQFGMTATPVGSGADGDASGNVDGGDLTVWESHFGEPAAAVAALTAGESIDARDSAALDSIYAGGDFTTLFAEVRSLRPQRRWRLGR
jgi:hypothetical protein